MRPTPHHGRHHPGGGDRTTPASSEACYGSPLACACAPRKVRLGGGRTQPSKGGTRPAARTSIKSLHPCFPQAAPPASALAILAYSGLRGVSSAKRPGRSRRVPRRRAPARPLVGPSAIYQVLAGPLWGVRARDRAREPGGEAAQASASPTGKSGTSTATPFATR